MNICISSYMYIYIYTNIIFYNILYIRCRTCTRSPIVPVTLANVPIYADFFRWTSEIFHSWEAFINLSMDEFDDLLGRLERLVGIVFLRSGWSTFGQNLEHHCDTSEYILKSRALSLNIRKNRLSERLKQYILLYSDTFYHQFFFLHNLRKRSLLK